MNKLLINTKNTVLKVYDYCTMGVWNDTRDKLWINLIKTLNLLIGSFLDKKLQQKAASLTYNTILAIVPVLALIFAIGRGFGFQNLLQSELFKYFPAQKEALTTAFVFVDSYLEQSSQGVFLGIGIIFLLWTLISLMNNVEQVFNQVWNIRKSRSMARKITDYTAIFMILPILMICEGGVSVFLSTTFSKSIFSPVLLKVLDAIPWLLTFLFFTVSFYIIPNTKVKLSYSLLAGLVCGTAFQVLQWIFVSGQMYVSKYNAIYGSFAFLPLLLIWIQLIWIITLVGVGITYSAQNAFRFNFRYRIENISVSYYTKISLVLLGGIIRRFKNGAKPMSAQDMANEYSLPIRLVGKILADLSDSELICAIDGAVSDDTRYLPAVDVHLLTVDYYFKHVANRGDSSFLSDFDENQILTLNNIDKLNDEIYERLSKVCVDNFIADAIP